jgi:hypothetical protein
LGLSKQQVETQTQQAQPVACREGVKALSRKRLVVHAPASAAVLLMLGHRGAWVMKKE